MLVCSRKIVIPVELHPIHARFLQEQIRRHSLVDRSLSPCLSIGRYFSEASARAFENCNPDKAQRGVEVLRRIRRDAPALYEQLETERVRLMNLEALPTGITLDDLIVMAIEYYLESKTNILKLEGLEAVRVRACARMLRCSPEEAVAALLRRPPARLPT